MTKQLEILVVEDREEFSKAARSVIEGKGYSMELAKTFKEAEECMKKKDYSFVLVDGFFPYSEEYSKRYHELAESSGIEEAYKALEETEEFKELSDIDDRFRKSETCLKKHCFTFDMVFLELLEGGSESTCPFGLALAERLKEKGKKYMIVSAADHHAKGYHVLQGYAREKGLKLYLEEWCGDSSLTKADPGYWEKALEMMEEEK
jgi:CheY-like chemotaxis protein